MSDGAAGDGGWGERHINLFIYLFIELRRDKVHKNCGYYVPVSIYKWIKTVSTHIL